LEGLGSRPVVVTRRLAHPPAPREATEVPPATRVPAPRNPLSTDEQISWTSVMVRGPVTSAASSAMECECSAAPQAAGSVLAAPVPLLPVSEDAKIPDPGRHKQPKPSKPKPKPKPAGPAAAPSGEFSTLKPNKVRLGGIEAFILPPSSRGSPPPPPISGPSVEQGEVTVHPKEVPPPSEVVAIKQFNALIA
jgi:hypothetical protein